MTDASKVAPPRVGETIEIRCPLVYGWARSDGSDLPPLAPWFPATVAFVTTNEHGAVSNACVSTQQACCGEHSHLGYGPEQHGTWWRRPEVKQAVGRPDVCKACKQPWFGGIGLCESCELKYAPPPADSDADRAMRSKERRESIAKARAGIERAIEQAAIDTATKGTGCVTVDWQDDPSWQVVATDSNAPCPDCGPTALCETHGALEKLKRSRTPEYVAGLQRILDSVIGPGGTRVGDDSVLDEAAASIADRLGALALHLAHHCPACASDLRSRLETRPYCAQCNPLFGNATVIAIEAPEPRAWWTLHYSRGRSDEVVWRAGKDGDTWLSHPLRSEAIRLWREAWVKRETERIADEAHKQRRALLPKRVEPATEPVSIHAARLQAEREKQAELLRRNGYTIGSHAAAGEAFTAVALAKRQEPKPVSFTATFAPTYIDKEWFEEKLRVAADSSHTGNVVAVKKADDGGEYTTRWSAEKGYTVTYQAPVCAPPAQPRVPQVGDEIEVRPEGEDEWLPAKVVAVPRRGQLTAHRGSRGYIIGMLENDPDDPWWRWPSEVKA